MWLLAEGAQAMAESGAKPGAEHEFLTIHPWGVSLHLDTLIFTWLAAGILLILALRARRGTAPIPTGLKALFENVYFFYKDLAESLMGAEGRKYVPLAMTIFLYVLFMNYMGAIPGFKPPTADLNTTLAMAIITFCAFIGIGIHKSMVIAGRPKGAAASQDHGAPAGPERLNVLGGIGRWLAHYVQPVPQLMQSVGWPMVFMLPLFLVLNIVEELARLISLSMRLFGNVMGEHKALSIFLLLVISLNDVFKSFSGAGKVALMAFTGPVFWASSLFIMALGLLAGMIQAFIFAVLTLSYISHAVAEEH